MKDPLRPNIRLIPRDEYIKDEQLMSRVRKMIETPGMGESRLALLDRWDRRQGNYYIIFDTDEGRPVGLIGWTGSPEWGVEPRWWVHRASRRKGYGRHAVEKLAEEMHLKGVKRIQEDLLIDTRTPGEAIASRKLVHRLRECFEKLKGAEG
jgi:RimJ/RimL family protein N-acetyltransferase